jgi:hypothetical protein
MMRELRNYLMALGLAFCASYTWSQNEDDVFRYSYQESLGSARTMGMGGAFGALGADLSCLSGNPAGIGMYRRGDLGITGGFASQKTKISVAGQLGNANKLSGTATNIGIALSYPSVNPDWPVSTLAVTFSNRANYNQRIEIDDIPFENSLLSSFLIQAQGYSDGDLNATFPFTAGLAWDTYLLDPDPNGNPTDYISAIPTGGALTSKSIERTGQLSETNIGFGSGLSEILYVGITLGIVNVEFGEETRHREKTRVDSLELSEWTYRENLDIAGSGINVKLGLILVPTPWLRLGSAYHSRSRLNLTDEYSTGISSTFKDGAEYDVLSRFNRFEYLVITPSRFMASAAFILGKAGLVSADYEEVNYASGELRKSPFSSDDAYTFNAENEALQRIYGKSRMARVGAEFRIQRDWRLRFGAGMETSPYTTEAQIRADAKRYQASFGWGYRSEKWYGAMTYRRSWTEQDLYLFSPDLVDVAKVGNTHGMVVAALGFRM